MCVCMYVCQHFQTFSPLKPLGRLKPNFIWSLLGMGERKFVQTVQVTWPRCSPCPYMVKTFKNLLLQNQKAYDLETWYVELGAQVLSNLFKWWPWVDLNLFYGKVKFGPVAFVREKGKTMDIIETIVVYDVKVGRCSKLNTSTWAYIDINGQGHSLTLVQGHSVSTFSNFFSWETVKPIEADIMLSLDGMEQWKFVQMVQVTWPKWPPCLYMVIPLLCNQNADDLESLYAAFDTQILPNLFKWWPWVDLNLFNGKVRAGPLCFCIGKS